MNNEIITKIYVRTCDFCRKTMENDEFFVEGCLSIMQHDENKKSPKLETTMNQKLYVGMPNSEFCLECYEDLVVNKFLEFKRKLNLKAFW